LGLCNRESTPRKETDVELLSRTNTPLTALSIGAFCVKEDKKMTYKTVTLIGGPSHGKTLTAHTDLKTMHIKQDAPSLGMEVYERVSDNSFRFFGILRVYSHNDLH
jgi:hypothetical protein